MNTMDVFEVLPFNSKDIVEVQLRYYDLDVKSPEDIVDEILEDYERYEAKKVVFELQGLDDFDKFFEIKKEMQCRHAVGRQCPYLKLEKVSSPESINDVFWPSNWTTSVTYQSNDTSQEEFSANFSKVCVLPNLEKLDVYGKYYINQIPLYFGGFRKLKHFSFQSSGISELPHIMRFFSDLEVLNLRCNCFKFLPFWITKLKNLKTLSRHQNYLEGNSNVSQITRKEKCEEEKDKEGNDKIKSPRSLYLQSATVAITAFPIIAFREEYTKELPKELLEDMTMISSTMKICDNCSSSLPDSDYFLIQKTVSNFKGYSNIPFEAFACSDRCSQELLIKFEAIDTGEIKEDQYCYDVLDSKPAKCRCYDCRNPSFIKKLFSCFR